MGMFLLIFHLHNGDSNQISLQYTTVGREEAKYVICCVGLLLSSLQSRAGRLQVLAGGSAGKGKDYPLRYSGLENSMDRIVHGVTKSQT